MKRLMLCVLVVCSLATVNGQSSNATRQAFQRAYPPGGPTYAVVIRGDLLTVAINGANGRERGRSKLPIKITEEGWKQAGSIGREPSTGNLALGEIVQVEKVDYSGNGIELQLRSVEPHEIVRDPDKPEKNRHEPVVTVLQVPYWGEIRATTALLDRYVRLFTTLDAARAYQTTLAKAQPDRRFTLAVMRRDGIVVPFAAYDNGRWYNRWPLPIVEREVPLGLTSVPREWWGVEGPGTTWTMWTPDGKARPVQLKAPIAFDAHCMMNVGLTSDYKSALPAPPLEQHHYPKDGVVSNGSVVIEPVETINATDQMWKNLEPMLRDSLSAEEAHKLVGLPPTDPRFRQVQPGVPAFEQVPINLEVLCAARGPSENTLTAYFESTKRYDPIDKTVPNPCGSITFTSGWVHRTPFGQGYLDSKTDTRLTDCTQWNIDFRRPLGLIRMGTKVYWIMQVAHWGGESYEVIEIANNQATLVLATPGGWCNTIGN